jgi:hypothetical protein
MHARSVGAGFLAVGAVLVASPLYLDSVLAPPGGGDGFNTAPLFLGALVGLGAVCLSSGVVLALPALDSRDPTLLLVGSGLGAVAVVAVVMVTVSAVVDPRTVYSGYGHRKTLVATSLVVVFVVCAALAAEQPQGAVAAPLLYLPGVVLTVLEPRTLTPTVLDHLLVVFDDAVMGVHFLGAGLFVVAALAGAWSGWLFTTRRG